MMKKKINLLMKENYPDEDKSKNYRY